MLFSGTTFIFHFLPCVLLLYAFTPRRFKNTVLLLASFFFYGWGEPKYILSMILAIGIAYISGILIERYRHRPKVSKWILILSVSLCLAMLGYFKYADFFISNFNAVTGLSLPLLHVALPLGISFYTFQILSYSIDVYRNEVSAQRNLLDLATYISLFPQLIAGPIVRYSHIEQQLKYRTHSLDKTTCGIQRFLVGLSKKVLLANTLGELCNTFRASSDISVIWFWIYALACSLQIYFDFSGYSDMAIGLGKMFDFDFPENFHYPFMAESITDFWRRWHMSLSSWFKDYVYIPLGGNRVCFARHLCNILIVWILTGLWHGAAWNFIIWGMYFALLLIAEKLWLLKFLKNHKIFSHIYVLFAVLISFVLFDASDLQQILFHIRTMFTANGYPLVCVQSMYYLRSYFLILLISIVGATPFPINVWKKLKKNNRFASVSIIAEPLMLVVLLILCTAYLVDGSFNPFLYFRF